MNKVCVFLFSGTGMTRYVILKIKTELEKQKKQVDIFNIEKIQIQSIQLDSYDIFGIAYPVHSLNAPKIVINFAKQLPKVESMNTFVINTVGGDSSFNFASSGLLIKVLTKKGFNVFYDKQFIMPSNFIVKNNDDEVNRRIASVNAAIPETTQEIINHLPSRPRSNGPAKIFALVGRLEWFGGSIAAFYYTDKNCNLCGMCAQNCPSRNIIIGAKRPRFRWNCGICMRCLYLCPNKSIKIHRPFAFIKFNDWYNGLVREPSVRNSPPMIFL